MHSARDLSGEPGPRLATRLVLGGLDSADGRGQEASRHFWGPGPGEALGFGRRSPRDHVYPLQEKEVLRRPVRQGGQWGVKIPGAVPIIIVILYRGLPRTRPIGERAAALRLPGRSSEPVLRSAGSLVSIK